MLRLEENDLASVRAWMNRSLGLRGEDYRPAFLARRIGSRLAATGCPDVRSYLELLAHDPHESGTMSSKLLVPTTEFFRNPEVFGALGRALAEISRRPGWSSLRVMSAPCSTGEEAVSLAILLEEMGLTGKILAVDRSRRALASLQAGVFGARSVGKLDLQRRARYFKEEGDKARVRPDIAARILPVCCDLTSGVPARRVHVVVMRNLFIYMTEAAQSRLLGEAGRVLLPGGLLALGRVEVLPRYAMRGWTPVDRDARIFEWTGGSE